MRLDHPSFFASSFVIRVNSEFAKFDIAFIFTFSGGYGGGATPDSIPNSEVKTSSADGTAWVTVWESRSLPDSL